MTDYPWYEEVNAAEPLLQGDIIEECPVLVFEAVPVFPPDHTADQVIDALEDAAGVQPTRAIVMTQACDLAQDHVRQVILCPIYHLPEYRAKWEEAETARGQNPTEKNWAKHTRDLKDGKVWNLTMLNERPLPEGGGMVLSHQVVDFHEVFSLPVAFLRAWILAKAQNRLRVCPPYREQLSQAFARFFMRVGLPIDINL